MCYQKSRVESGTTASVIGLQMGLYNLRVRPIHHLQLDGRIATFVHRLTNEEFQVEFQCLLMRKPICGIKIVKNEK